MTPARVIAALDELTPNSYDFRQKLAWLSRVENSLGAEVGRTASAPLGEDTLLLAASPYDELYIRYLQAQIHLEAGEITRYNNAMVLYNNALAGFRRAHIRGTVTPQPFLTGY